MTKNCINVVVAGATGYVGLDLVYLLSKHSKVKIINLCAQKSIGKQIKTASIIFLLILAGRNFYGMLMQYRKCSQNVSHNKILKNTK